MATHIISLEYPNPVNWGRWFRNGMVPAAQGYRWLAQQLANSAQLRKKLLFVHTQDLANIETAEAGSKTRWRFSFRSGYASTQLLFVMVMGLEDHATGVDPLVNWTVTEVGVGSTTSPDFRYGLFGGTPGDTPDEFLISSQFMALVPNAEYECLMNTEDYARPIACAVYELGASTGLDDTLTGAVDPTRFSLGMPILDDDMVMLAEASIFQWKQNGSQLIGWSAENSDGTGPPSQTGTSYQSFWATAPETVDANSKGFKPQLTNHNTATETDVPVEFKAYVEYEAGAPTEGTEDQGYVRYIDSASNVLEITNIQSTGWVSQTGTLPAQNLKGVVEGKVDADNGAGAFVKLHSFSLMEYES